MNLNFLLALIYFIIPVASLDQLPINTVIWIDGNACPVGWIKYEKLSARVPVGSSDEMVVGDVGGQANTVLTEANCPSHSHYVFSEGGRVGRVEDYPNSYATFVASVSRGGLVNENFEYQIQGSTVVASRGKTSSVGSASSFSNMPPYLVLLACIKVSDGIDPFVEYDARMGNYSAAIMSLQLKLGNQERESAHDKASIESLTLESGRQKEDIDSLTQESGRQKDSIESLTQEIGRQKVIIELFTAEYGALITELVAGRQPTPAPDTSMPTMSMSPTATPVGDPPSIPTMIRAFVWDIEFMSRFLLGIFFVCNICLGVYWKADLRELDPNYISKISIIGLLISYADLWLDIEMCVYLYKHDHYSFSYAMIVSVVLPIIISTCICLNIYLFHIDEDGQRIKGNPEISDFYKSQYLPLKLMACTNLDILVLLPWEYERFINGEKVTLKSFADFPTEKMVRMSLWRYLEDGPQIVIQLVFILLNGYNALAVCSLGFSCLTMFSGLLRKLEQISRSRDIRRTKVPLDDNVNDDRKL